MASQNTTTLQRDRLLEADLRAVLELCDDLEAVLGRLGTARLAPSERDELRRAIGSTVARTREAALLVAANYGIGPEVTR